MLSQVANSKGTEWMVSSYNAWQQRYQEQSLTQKSISSLFRIPGIMTDKSLPAKRSMTFAFKLLVLIIGLILAVKSI